MDVPDEDHMMDNVSVVSCSTQKSDVTQNLELPDLCKNTEKKHDQEMYKDRSWKAVPRDTEGSEMSPLVPVQLNAFTQKSSGIEDSASVMSEPLIPVISTKSSTVINKSSFDVQVQESRAIEESQSLLPQVPALSFTLYPNLGTENDKDNGASGNKGNKKNNSTESNKDSSKSDTPFTSGSSSNNVSASQPMVFTSGKEEFILSQPLFSTSGKDHVTLSQVDQAGRNAREICSSQRTVTLTSPLEKDPADRIISRLDRLVSSLDKVPKRQKMVMEATILQCITSLQDSLNSKLKKHPSAAYTAGILKKLLQTTQTGLLKLTEQHKLEKLQLSQSTCTQSTQQTSSQLTQSAVSDLGKRQKRMFSLLKRQKYLVDLYKTTKRTEAETSHIPVKTGQRNRKAESKQMIKSGNTKQSSHDKLDKNYSGNSAEGGTSNIIADVETKKTSKDKIESDFENKRQNDKFKVTVVQGEQDQLRGIDTCTRETKLKRGVDFEGQFNVKDIEKQTRLGDNEGGILSQDLTTVPDTQDLITQDSMLASGNGLDSDGDVAATAGSAEDLSEHSDKKIRMEITKQGTETSGKVTSERDKINASNMEDIENILDKVSLKRDIGTSVKADKNIKKQKLNDIEEGIQTPENTKNNSTEAKHSEVLWLKMLRDDTNKGIENKKVSIDRTVEKQPDQEILTAKRLEKGQMGVNIKEPAKNDTEKNIPDFQFIKPSFTPKQDLLETGNRIAQSKEQMKDDRASSEKMDKDDQTNHKITRTHSAKGREILCSKEKEEEIVGLSSPPNVTIPGETWHNVSPTATSMSSDVFMVKVKDLQKRMNRRVELSQNIDSDRLSSAKHLEKTDIIGKPSGKVMDIQEDLEQNSNQKTENHDTYMGNIVKEKDTVSEAIDSVIKQSREMSARNEGFRKGAEMNKERPTKVGQLYTCDVNQTVLQETRFKAQARCSQEPRPSYGQLSLNDTEDIKTGTSKTVQVLHYFQQQLTVGLPTLKDLIHSGQLTPGKLVLSCYMKGKTHRASLTPQGKVRTLEGLVFVTASQWVSTLTDATPVKKRKAYEMVQYKGRQLLSFCVNNPGLSEPNKQPANIIQDVSSTPSTVRMFTEQGTQVEDSEIPKVSSQLTEDEKRLNSLLSSCVVRLLTEQDFISCDDLPANFWTEDFSKVRLHKDIWDTVDAW